MNVQPAVGGNADARLGWHPDPIDDVALLRGELDACRAEINRLRSESVPRSALVQVGWYHGDGFNVTAFRPAREGQPTHPERWRPVYVLRGAT